LFENIGVASIADVGTEIERKFLVVNGSWKSQAGDRRRIVQGYLANTERGSVRIRISGEHASLNIKSMTLGVTRSEYEYAIPIDEAEQMLNQLCLRPLIEKTRYFVQHGKHLWEIDEFHGDNQGLVVAEVELKSDSEKFTSPEWLGAEVSDDPRYYNVCLVDRPFTRW